MAFFVKVLFFITLGMAVTVSLSAKVYRFRDDSGVLHFTDNILDVPPAQRETAEASPEIISPVPETTRPAEPAAEEKKGPDARHREYQQLLEEQENLDRIFLELEAQKEALERERQGISTPKQLEAFRKKIEAFNQRATEFTAQKESFAQKSSLFNQRNRSSQP